MDDEIKPVYQYVEETGLPDWSKYNFLTPQDAVEWSIIQGTVLVSSLLYAELVADAVAEDWEDQDFLEVFNEARIGMLGAVGLAEAWWKERER